MGQHYSDLRYGVPYSIHWLALMRPPPLRLHCRPLPSRRERRVLIGWAEYGAGGLSPGRGPLWPAGPLARCGPLDRCGPLARWPAGPLARWPAGPLARWPAGPLARCGSPDRFLRDQCGQSAGRHRMSGGYSGCQHHCAPVVTTARAPGHQACHSDLGCYGLNAEWCMLWTRSCTIKGEEAGCDVCVIGDLTIE